MQEYLSVIQHSSNTKTWANDDDIPPPAANDPTEKAQPEAEDAPQDLTYAQRKKAKLGGVEDSYASEKVEDEPMVVDASGDAPDPEAAAGEDGAAQTEEQPVSDADWLRSKTSRLLGLLDEDEQAEFDSAPRAPPAEPSDTGSEKAENAEPAPEDTAKAPQAPEVDTNIENIRLSARLFVRNLPYDTTEADLEPVFGPFGRVEEVSAFAFSPSDTSSLSRLALGRSHDDHPDRDIRCKACDVNRTRDFSRCFLESEERLIPHLPCC